MKPPAEVTSGPTTHPTGGAGTGPKRLAYAPKEAASLLGVPYKTVMWMIHNDQLGHVMCGRYYRIPAEEISRLLAPAIKAA